MMITVASPTITPSRQYDDAIANPTAPVIQTAAAAFDVKPALEDDGTSEKTDA